MAIGPTPLHHISQHVKSLVIHIHFEDEPASELLLLWPGLPARLSVLFRSTLSNIIRFIPPLFGGGSLFSFGAGDLKFPGDDISVAQFSPFDDGLVFFYLLETEQPKQTALSWLNGKCEEAAGWRLCLYSRFESVHNSV
ncbi:hypothetical protein Droror1_Dr00016882 [Drosera rotundifolia]